MVEIKDIVEPRWVLDTKRGWGMLITFAATLLPWANMWLKSKYGVELDAPMVGVFGDSVTGMIDAVGKVVGVSLWIYGSFKPTAPLTLKK